MNVYDEKVSDFDLAEIVCNQLSPRELEVLLMISAGKHTKQIAATLFVSARTIDSRRYTLSRKLRIPTTAEQAVLGWRIRKHVAEIRSLQLPSRSNVEIKELSQV